MPGLSDSERLDWLRLYRSENIGPQSFHRLLATYGTAARALDALPGLAQRGGFGRPLRIASRAAAERELETLAKLGGRLLCAGEPGFPARLAELETAPLLTLLGHPHLLDKPAVAIVGARNASLAGRRMAQGLAGEIGRAGLVVVSGMARGIDGAAHEGALATGTVAVLAGGVDLPYPPEHAELYQRIAASGCVISEMPPGTQPRPQLFPRRNRLISGLALGVVVVEAAAHSGSLITARLAAEQGREVFAVPGSPLDARAAGPNSLIKQGAALVETAADVIGPILALRHAPLGEPPGRRFDAGGSGPPAESELAAARRQVVEALGVTPVTVDEILRQCHLSPAVLSMVLLELELAGRLERHPGNQVSLAAAAS